MILTTDTSYTNQIDLLVEINKILFIIIPESCYKSKICSYTVKCSECIFYSDVVSWSINNIDRGLPNKYLIILSSVPKMSKNIKDNYGPYLSKIFTNKLRKEIEGLISNNSNRKFYENLSSKK